MQRTREDLESNSICIKCGCIMFERWVLWWWKCLQCGFEYTDEWYGHYNIGNIMNSTVKEFKPIQKYLLEKFKECDSQKE